LPITKQLNIKGFITLAEKALEDIKENNNHAYKGIPEMPLPCIPANVQI
jgi:hypothetical protein